MGTLAFSVGLCFCGLVDQGIATLLCFLLGKVLVWCQTVACCLWPGGRDSDGRTPWASVGGPLSDHHKGLPPLTCIHCCLKSEPCPSACSKREVYPCLYAGGLKLGNCSEVIWAWLSFKLIGFILRFKVISLFTLVIVGLNAVQLRGRGWACMCWSLSITRSRCLTYVTSGSCRVKTVILL